MRRIARTIKFLFKLGLIAGIFGLLAVIGVFAYYAKDLPDPDAIISQGPDQSTKIFDRTGEVILFEIAGDQRRTVIDLEDIPLTVQNAFISIEDDDFYNHSGIDPRAILRAVLANFRSGGISQGGSTITQQYIKNSLLSTEQTYTRKIKEVILAILLERRYTKDEILGFYLNQIPFGSNIYGLDTAARSFFNKSVNELTIAEAAILAAIPQAPTYYSPYGSHPEELMQRKDLVLRQMEKQAYISESEYEAALEQEIEFAPQDSNIKAPHFVMYVIEQLEEKLGQDTLQTQGYNVITTIDYELQQEAEEIIAERGGYNARTFDASNAALVAVDPRNGEIVTMVGSRDFFDIENDGQVNVTIRDRQPGSSFKPFAYTTAFEKGFTTETMLFDVDTPFEGNKGELYAPQNYSGTFSGPVTMRQALARSLNIPAVKALYLAGVNSTIDLAERLGISTLEDRSRFGLSLVLGGGEVKPLEMAAAYAAFANEGIRVDTTPILQITDRDGELIEWNDDDAERFESDEEDKNEGRNTLTEKNRALEKEIARQITDVLSDNNARAAVFGVNNSLVIPGHPVAAKTGTTNEFRDAWTIGFTPSISAAVWVGNNDNRKMKDGAAGASLAAPIWNNFMREALKGQRVEFFKKPGPVETSKDVLNGKFAAERVIEIDTLTGKLATSNTPPNLIEERIYKEVHTILHYARRSDPQGPIPTPAQRDARYDEWEGPVQAWVAEQPAEAGYNIEPPTEFDDVHTDSNRPRISITSPRDGASLDSDIITIKTSVSSSSKVRQVDFFVNNELLGSDQSSPYELTAPISSTAEDMDYVITVKVFDTALNQSSHSIAVTTGDEPIEPLNSGGTGLFEVALSEIKEKQTPYRITFEVDGGVRGATAVVYYANLDTPNQWETIKKYASVRDDKYSFRWRTAPNQEGLYEIFVVVEDDDFGTSRSNSQIIVQE